MRDESETGRGGCLVLDRKSTRLNSSHSQISYAVFCLKKKKKTNVTTLPSTHNHYQHDKQNHDNTPNYLSTSCIIASVIQRIYGVLMQYVLTHDSAVPT